MIGDFLHWIQSGLQSMAAGIAVRIREEPAGTATVVRLGLYAAAAFGLGWTAEQLVVFAAFLEGVTQWVARKNVTPNVHVDAEVERRLAAAADAA